MAGETDFEIGATAHCTDGSCGELRRIVIDPATDTVTHLVIEHKHGHEPGRLVPVHLVEAAAGEIRLSCTLTQFASLQHAEERKFADAADQEVGRGGLGGDDTVYSVSGREYMSHGAAGFAGGVPMDPVPIAHRTILQDVVPLGEDQVRPGDRVHCVDGEIGHVHGFIVSPGDDRVTHVLLQEGHLWGHKEVAIPISAVTGFDTGIRLNMTKQQVEALPPVP
jgi:uncharacterized protein YrrD